MQGLTDFGQNMAANLQDLYQEVIVDHSKYPRFKSKPTDQCQICQEGKNPLCGDELTLFCKVLQCAQGSMARLSLQFTGKGCAISQASASMMCELVQNKCVAECKSLIKLAEATYTGKRSNVSDEELESDLDALAGVSQFPVRVKCAALPWKTLELILDSEFNSQGLFCQKMAGPNCPPTVVNRLKVVLDD